MTPGTLVALVEDNVRHYENILTTLQIALYKADAQDMLLAQDIIAKLRRIESAPIAHPELDLQVRHALQERHQQEAKWRAQLEAAELDITGLIGEFRALVAQREQRFAQTWQDYIAQPAYAALQRQVQELLQARQPAQDSLARLVEERDSKMPAYENNPFYVHLRTRRYSTDDYVGSRLFRSFDDWLATKVNYRENRRNELILRSMPDRVAVLVDEYSVRLKALEEQNNASWAQTIDELSNGATAQRRTLLAKQIIAAKTRANTAYNELLAYLDGEDSYTQDIDNWIDQQLGDQHLEDILGVLVNECPTHEKSLSQYWTAVAESSTRLTDLDERVDSALGDYQHAKELEWALRNLRTEETNCVEGCNCACHQQEDFEGQCPCLYDDERYYHYPPGLDCAGLIATYMKRNLQLDDLMEQFTAQRQSFSSLVPEQEHSSAPPASAPVTENASS